MPALLDLRDRSVAALARLLLFVIGASPIALSYRLAAFAAALLTPLVIAYERRASRKRTSMRRNFRIAFGAALDEASLRRLTRATLRHMAWLIVDLARLPRLRPEDVESIVSPEQVALMKDLTAAREGIIWVTGHIGTFELCGAIPPHLGIPLSTVTRFSPNKHLTRLINELRGATGQILLDNRNVLFELKACLKRGESVGLLVDENTKRKPVFVPFFGVLASANRAVANLHRLTGSPIVVGGVHRLAPGRFRLTVSEVIRHPKSADREVDEEAIMRRLAGAMESCIRAHPEQWLWNMRRWKERPLGEVPDPDGLPPRVAPAIPPDLFNL